VRKRGHITKRWIIAIIIIIILKYEKVMTVFTDVADDAHSRFYITLIFF